MVKYAHFDSAATQPTPVIGWYDTGVSNYPNMPAAADLLEIADEAWPNRFATPYVLAGALVATPPPSLVAVQAEQVAALRAACAAEITGGYTSSALGAVHSYASGLIDQTNMAASVLASLLPGLAQDWSTPFSCADAAGIWALRAHTTAQIQQVGQDAKAFVVAAQQKLAALTAEVAIATTVEAVRAVAW